jgi:hypothetical protein
MLLCGIQIGQTSWSPMLNLCIRPFETVSIVRYIQLPKSHVAIPCPVSHHSTTTTVSSATVHYEPQPPLELPSMTLCPWQPSTEGRCPHSCSSFESEIHDSSGCYSVCHIIQFCIRDKCCSNDQHELLCSEVEMKN